MHSRSNCQAGLDFAVSEGEWKLIKMDMKVKGSSTSDAGSLLTHATGDVSAAGSVHPD